MDYSQNMVGKHTIEDYDDKKWGKVISDFEESFALQTEMDVKFNGIMKKLFESRGIYNGAAFEKLTGIDARYYKEFTEKESYIPSKAKLVKVCLSLNVDVMKAMRLLELLGSGFRKDRKVDYAYYYLLLKYQGENIENCNTILEKLDIDEKYWL